MNQIAQDIRFGFRMLFKNPVVTLVAVVALTLGIGANTAIFSVVHAVMLGSLPYPNADQLAIVWEKQPANDQNTINIGNFTDWKKQNNVFSDMAAFVDYRSNLIGDGAPEEIPSQLATPNLFSVLGVNPIRGRTFTPEDAQEAGAATVVVISYGLWQRRFGGDENIIGRKITLNDKPVTVIGVMPSDFGWHVRKSSRTRKPAEIWAPWKFSEQMLQRRGRFANSVARLKPGVTIEQAQSEMNTIAARLQAEYPEFNTNFGVNVVPVRIQFSGELRKPLMILLGAVAFVLLIACANVANLLLVRATARKKEMAVRIGLGASHWRVVRQLLTESLMLSAVGGALGLLVAVWGTRALIAIGPPSLASLRDVGVNLTVLGFTLGVALLTGVVFGLVPAFEATRVNFNDSLKEGGKNIGGSVAGQRFRNLFVVTQVALALLLVVGAGLLLKSLNRLQSVDPGFNSKNLLTFRINLPLLKYDDPHVLVFFHKLTEQIQAIPGVESVGAIDTLPFTSQHSGTVVHIEGQPDPPPGHELGTGVSVVDRTYLQTMQIPLKRGRLFTPEEAAEMRHVVVINEKFARVNLPGQDPIGKRVIIEMKDENVPSEIIGVVGDSKHMGLDKEPEEMAYWPHPELTYSQMTVAVRTKTDAASFAPAVRNVVAGLDPELPMSDVATMENLLAASVSRSRFNTTLLTIFAAVALVMSVVGIYGVMSYSVSQRTHEIGIRVALGAQKRDVISLIVMRGLVLATIGIVVGLAASLGLTRLLASLLFEVDPKDVTVFGLVAIGCFLITLLACYIPALRATKVDPLVALRYE